MSKIFNHGDRVCLIDPETAYRGVCDGSGMLKDRMSASDFNTLCDADYGVIVRRAHYYYDGEHDYVVDFGEGGAWFVNEACLESWEKEDEVTGFKNGDRVSITDIDAAYCLGQEDIEAPVGSKTMPIHLTEALQEEDIAALRDSKYGVVLDSADHEGDVHVRFEGVDSFFVNEKFLTPYTQEETDGADFKRGDRVSITDIDSAYCLIQEVVTSDADGKTIPLHLTETILDEDLDVLRDAEYGIVIAGTDRDGDVLVEFPGLHQFWVNGKFLTLYAQGDASFEAGDLVSIVDIDSAYCTYGDERVLLVDDLSDGELEDISAAKYGRVIRGADCDGDVFVSFSRRCEMYVNRECLARYTPEDGEEDGVDVENVAGMRVSEDGQVIAVSNTGGAKQVKPARASLVPVKALTELFEHYGKGEAKYPTGEDKIPNFRRGYDWSLSYDAMIRHALAFWGGEDYDQESGSKHIIAAAWHALTLAQYMDEHPEFDNRPDVAIKRKGD